MRAEFTDKACTGGRIVKVEKAVWNWNIRGMLYVPGRYKTSNNQANGLLDDFSRLADKYDYAYDPEVLNLRDITEDVFHTDRKCFYNLPNLDSGRQCRKWSEFYIRIWETFNTGRPWPEYGAILVPDFEGRDT